MPNICQKSAQRYFQLASQCIPTLGFTNKVQKKIVTRFIAENSVINAMSMLIVVATTYFQVAEPDNTHPPISDAIDGANFFESILSKVNGNMPIRPIPAYLNTSTDDSTVFVFNGETFVNSILYLNNNSQKSSNLSTYSCEVGGTYHINGLCVRHTHSMNAFDNIAPIYLTVYGLNEREIPRDNYPSGIFVMEIEDLCFGGAQDVRKQNVGYIVFMRNEIDSVTGDTNETKKYRNTVCIPWIDKIREQYAGFVAGRSGIPVPEELTCCSWCDGEKPQLRNVVSPEQMIIDKIQRIISNKHATAATAVQQDCDACPVFNTLNGICKFFTAKNLPMN